MVANGAVASLGRRVGAGSRYHSRAIRSGGTRKETRHGGYGPFLKGRDSAAKRFSPYRGEGRVEAWGGSRRVFVLAVKRPGGAYERPPGVFSLGESPLSTIPAWSVSRAPVLRAVFRVVAACAAAIVWERSAIGSEQHRAHAPALESIGWVSNAIRVTSQPASRINQRQLTTDN